ncbi:hypothetical protein GQ54DRAFT_75121 [Martensiomyces pterosporus]|nr:hypothetical protein GQ54DRAFT_75121 [Martensiomyces pterosporus]
MPPVTFNIDPDTKDSLADSSLATTALSTGSECGAGWQEGRAARIRSLEAALDVTVRRKKRRSQQQRSKPDTADYRSMLEGEDGEEEHTSQDASDGGDTDASSDFYGEGQPLLRTYQPPEMPNATYSSPLAGDAPNYGSVRASLPAKTPEQYLPWDVRLRDAIRNLCVSSCLPGCCCAPRPGS